MLDDLKNTMYNFSTLVELLRYRGQYQGDKIAYTFLQDGEIESSSLTYGELDQQAQGIAASLQSLGTTGERALLLYPPSLEFIIAFFGCLYAGIVPVPAYPPRRNHNMSRLETIVVDAQATFALTISSELANLESRWALNSEISGLRWLATDEIDKNLSSFWQEPTLSKNTLAFLQYTSGSTGKPKGVMVSHGNILHNERLIQMAFGHTKETIFVGWLPLFHDMGLIGNVLQPLYLGIPSFLMSPVAFLQQPVRWLQAISRYKATTSGGPNFAYDLCVNKITPEQISSLDLSSWEVAFNGSEPIRAETLQQFARKFADCGFRYSAFYPCYGMAETTLFVSGGLKTAPPVLYNLEEAALEQNQVLSSTLDQVGSRTIVGCGLTLFDKITIVDPKTMLQCRSDQVGEIWVSGSSVAQGYWNQPQLTEQIFNADIANTDAIDANSAPKASGSFLRTGDLGFFQNGELFVTGRLKDIIIIRGRNYYPQDIELTLEKSHPGLRFGCSASFGVEVNGEEKLVVACEVERSYLRQLNVDEVVGAIRSAISQQHEIQAYAVLLLRTASIPKTSSGKIQRHACKVGFLDESLDIVGSSILEDSYLVDSINKLDRETLLAMQLEDQQGWLLSYLQKRVAQVLKVAPSQLDQHQPLTTLGFDSLMAVELKNEIETSFGVILPMTSFLESSGTAQIAIEILNQFTASSPTLETALVPIQQANAEYPLSYGQRSLWFLHQLTPDSPAYNIAAPIRIKADLDIPALQRAFQKLVDRHPALRTTFMAPDGEPKQQVHNFKQVYFQVENASAWSETFLNNRLVEDAYRPFDLKQGPLLRVNLFTRSTNEYILLLVVHHIIADFWSLSVLLQEMGKLYQAEKDGTTAALAPLELQYTDYAHASVQMLANAEGAKHWAYWQKQLAGELPTLNLPTDRPRPPVQTYQGASQSFKLNAELTSKLKALSRAHGTTLYTTLLAAFQVLLLRYTGQEDLLVGSPTGGRVRAELAGLIGYFVNPIVCRANLSGNPTFKEFLNQVRSKVLDAFKHQDYPFALLVERLQPTRDLSISPLFQVMFVMQKAHLLHDEGLTAFALGETGAKMSLGDLQLESLGLEQRIAQFDLTLTIAEVELELAASLEYNIDLFDTDTIYRMSEHLQTLLEEIVANPEQPVSKLPLLTAFERHQLVEWNQTQSNYPQDKCIHQLFEEQVERTPEAVAVVFEDLQITYRELNTRANKLAHYLQQLGVKPEQLVGICIDRSIEILVAFLGVLKAGGAYIPLDPQLPKQRWHSILNDSQLRVLLTQEKLLPQLPESELHKVCIDRDWGTISQHKSDNPRCAVHPENLAYVIYTSGSTGKPKGVLIQHSSLSNHSCAIAKKYDINSNDRTLEFAVFSFDQAGEEIFPPLLSGATMVMRPDRIFTSIVDFVQFVEKEKLTVLNLPTPYWLEWTRALSQLDVYCPKSVRLVVVGMEKTQPEQLAFWRQQVGTNVKWYNAYGPTETTITATLYQPVPCAEKDIAHCVPIGRSIANTQTYILDNNLQSVPIGVPGELHIGGFGLARGYLNHPELTAQKFIPNPFSNEPGARLYKTGDLVRYMSDGNIEFLGRIDNQVKIRGFRIELPEIEAILTQHPEVAQAVVIVQENQLNDKCLIAYVVPKKQALTTTTLRNFLNEKLPEYMIPAIFVMLEALPFLPNGKINRRALPEPESLRPELNVAYVMPQTKIERLIAAVWQEMLQVEKVGIYDNFFELGGHSLLMVQIHSRLIAILDNISILDMFKYPSIHTLAKYLSNKHSEEIVSENRSRLEIRSDRQTLRNQQKQLRQTHRAQTNAKGVPNE
ncbi:hypothetical protein DSM106972_090650 [Dulcicalothrix desertica PCC 7102]|uniref:Carrier domain-containing protein n=1 Tax=Dulcicalothrix desertica PCC 7102 TaxID=232991 RepID=A0A433UN73_9CYAN|nr:non-ribosomal peptide synthetase [Dulcicalothrix desertica]RUS95289.1 hypothetical protein DSM106972_090650 [Dulcicalothrix desertica PCC 7102]TWH43977.1 amino acid adenylation domain-containing protein [Dulcicalothrix desertica PCC 7102]